MRLKQTDYKLLGLLLLLGLVMHFSFLTHPREVVFDEVHFGTFVNSYCCSGQNFFDIHPPHAKLIIAGAAKLGGYPGGFNFANIGDKYTEQVPLFAFRFPAALMGSLLPLVIFILVRQLGGGRLISFVAGWFILFDTALTVQSRLIALDSILLLATFASLTSFLAATNSSGKSRWIWLIAAGLLAALAAGTKFTGLAALLLLGIMSLVAWLKSAWKKEWLIGGITILISFIVFYLAGWALHFLLLTSAGPGDAFHTPNFADGFWPLNFLRETISLHQVMFSANYGLSATHPYASHWWLWPIMARPIFYWQGGGSLIYFLGNPFIWWSALILFVSTLVSGVISFGRGEKKEKPTFYNWLPTVGYFISMVPLMRVPRPLFLYHYLTPLIFSIIVGLLWLDSRLLGSPGRKYLYIFLLVISASFFLIFSPLVYGIPLTETWLQRLFWFTSWR